MAIKTPPAMQLQNEIIRSVPRLKLQSFDDFLATIQIGINAHMAITMYTTRAVTASKTSLFILSANVLQIEVYPLSISQHKSDQTVSVQLRQQQKTRRVKTTAKSSYAVMGLNQHSTPSIGEIFSTKTDRQFDEVWQSKTSSKTKSLDLRE